MSAQPAGLDAFDGRRAATVDGILRPFSDLTVLEASDVHTAITLGRLAGGADDEVLLAAALAVRAVRMGHVYVDLATVAATAAPDDEEVEIDVAALPWPEPASWPALVAASSLTATGDGGPRHAGVRVDGRPLRLLGSRLYLERYWRHERRVADDLRARGGGGLPPVDEAVLAAGLIRLFGPPPDARTGADDLQRLAAATAVRRRLCVVAGGPGTGKTTTVARILVLLHEQAAALGAAPPRVALTAPTGKAAARLAEAVHEEAGRLPTGPAIRRALLATSASTLHRLLGWQAGNQSRFRHDAADPLAHNVVVVDESSMVSLSLMARLLDAVRPAARLILVGDPRQLASVEAGAVLGDIVGLAPAGHRVGSEAASPPDPGGPVADGIVVLRRVHRFGAGVAGVAEAIDAGDPGAT
ncbi:MAG: AAA family ATPase, partial [Acidimicrobiales bacterium]